MVSHYPAKFGDHGHRGGGDIRHRLLVFEICFSLSRDLSRPRYQRVMRIYGWEPLMLSHYTAKFGGYS